VSLARLGSSWRRDGPDVLASWKLTVRIPVAGCLRGRLPAINPTGASKEGSEVVRAL
jgi:hypothetical protein